MRHKFGPIEFIGRTVSGPSIFLPSSGIDIASAAEVGFEELNFFRMKHQYRVLNSFDVSINF
ncbi:MAG TPA: hypothetical protein DCQ28_02785 [Bacteroidetes bacterium]|nr:hypothetical protein [Bacteroidota bacterium]